DMSAALKAAGFSVVEALDADRRKFDGALRAFADQLAKADVAVFFYAGHGIQVGQQNYLIPVDAKLERER
ncbi:caspase family protein, partial [Klebsiella pneumoniae]|uniref:caspase family protein n=1 Tax=Klebsiella pneumoniae TaxID=573 RepID=UPI003EDEF6CA